MIVAVIPARGGSKRIPRKNIKLFCGKPMIAWSIISAQQSGLFDRIIVSTDDEEIAQVARDWGAEAPFVRPVEFSGDYVGTTEVIAHAVDWFQRHGMPLTAVCCIYATAPLMIADDLVRGFNALKSGDWAYAFSVAEFSPSIYRALQVSPDGGVGMIFSDYFLTRSQDLPTTFHDAGQFYWGRPSSWSQGLKIFDEHSKPVTITRLRVQDIDDMDDWIRAEMIFKQMMSDQTQ